MSIEQIRPKSTFPLNRNTMVHTSSDDHELISSTTSEDSHAPLSETVTTLASRVYQELERIIKNFGENSVKDLMPVMISTLESLDNALHEREVNKLEVESLKEQTEQLYQQYEREKSFHKEYQQRYLQVEDHLEEIKRENEEKLRSLESIVKIFEIKARNASDHVGRLEDKENEMKQEYKRLHDRYCELFKVHCDYMERTKILYGTDRLDQSNTNSQSRGNIPLSATNQSLAEKQTETMAPSYSDISLTLPKETEFDNGDVKHTQTESMASNDAAVNTAKLAKLTMMDEVSLKEFSTDHDNKYLEDYKRGIFTKLRNLNLLSKPFDEQQFFVTEDEFEHPNNITDMTISDDDDDISIDDSKNLEAFDKETRNDNIDISDVDASADLFVRQSFYGMTKEVSNLIKENNELLETKNALNVLKDDLLVKIEELSNDLEIAREEVESLQTVRTRLQSRVTEVEEELRKIREELEKKKEEEKPLMISKGTQTMTHDQQIAQEDSSSISKEITSVKSSATNDINSLTSPTAKSLWSMFSEDWLPTSIVPTNILGVPVVDIQSDLREGTTQISEFFSGLFGSTGKEASPKRPITPTITSNLSSSTDTKQSSTNEQMASTTTTNKNPPLERSTKESTSADRLEQSSSIRHDSSCLTADANRFTAYGWSFPSKNHLKASSINGKVQNNIPIPIHCQPLFNTNDKTQIWCAAGIDLTGLSVNANETSVDELNKQLIESYHQMVDEQYLKLSSLVWIAAAQSNGTAMISIIDSNKPDKIIDTFTLGNAIIYAMGSVPGLSSTDYEPFDDTKLNEKTSTNDVKVISCTIASLSSGGNRPNTTDTSEQDIDQVKTKYPTVWLGSSDGWLYIHSAIGDHRTIIGKVWLRHAIYSIVHVRGRIFVSLANEKLIVFHRNKDGTWNLKNIHLITTGKSRESIRCTINVKESIWCGVANRVYVIDSQTFEIRKQFEVHPRSEHSVQHMTWSGDGVWLSVRLSSSLQLYHAQTYQHIQDVDIQPYIEKMIVTEKTGLFFVHITSLTIACGRLWIGTGNGIIISVPLTDSITSTSTSTSTKPGSVVRVYDKTSSLNSIPYCSMTNAQLSFHGFRDAVKFFVAIPGKKPTSSIHEETAMSECLTTQSSTDLSSSSSSSSSSFGDILVMSGGDGYIDFRIGNTITPDNRDNTAIDKGHVSYLILWHLGSS